MVNLRNIYNSLKKLVENAGLNSVEPFFMDPDVGASQMPQLPPKPPTEFEKVTLAQVQGENSRAQLKAQTEIKNIESKMRQTMLEFELKIKELELKYGSKIDEANLKRRSMLEQTDLNKAGDLMKEMIKGQNNSSQMDKETQIRQGKRAEQLLNDPLLKTAFEDLLEIYKQEIFNTKFTEDDKRTYLWVAYNLVDKIRGHLQSIMTSGKLSQDELDQLNKRS